MITIFPSLQSLLFVCVECSQQQQQQITFINWFLATKSVCGCVHHKVVLQHFRQTGIVKPRTFCVLSMYIFIYTNIYVCRAVASIAALLSVFLSFPLHIPLSLSNGFSNAYSAQSWEYKCLLIVQQVLHRSEGVTEH